MIKLPTLEQSPNGKSIWRIYKTPRARRIALTTLRHIYPHLNYSVFWKDVQGYGLEMAHALWLKPGQTYHNA